MPLVSAVMCTYRRFHCVECSMNYFLNQDFKDAELIIYNTDTDYPLQLGNSLRQIDRRVRIINNGTDFVTGKLYTNIGAIRRDSLQFANGRFYNCWDDDDIFLPYHLSQLIEGIQRTNRKAFKPSHSFFRNWDKSIQIVQNVMEASLLVEKSEVDFNLQSGTEHLSWYTRLRDQGQLNENEENTVPAYCFDWQRNPDAEHKQSGAIDNPNNFENHKEYSKDRALRPLEKIECEQHYKPFYEVFRKQEGLLHNKLVQPYL